MVVTSDVKGNCASGECNYGKGDMEFESGAKYSGNWQGGKQSGEGEMTYKDGTAYKGEWKDGMQNGFEHIRLPARGGIIIKETGKNGRRHGQGTMVFPSGVIYIGSWKWTKGTEMAFFISANGDVLKVTFEKDDRVKDEPVTDEETRVKYIKLAKRVSKEAEEASERK